MQISDNDLNGKHVIGALAVSLAAFFMFTPNEIYQAGDNGEFAFGGVFAVSLVALIPLGFASYFKIKYQKAVYIASLAVITAVSILGQNGVALNLGPQNFEQCMLKEMKGQPHTMTQLVARECRRRFPAK